MNKFFHLSTGSWEYTIDKKQLDAVNRYSITARTSMKYLFHNEEQIKNKMKLIYTKILKTKKYKYKMGKKI